MEKLNKNSKIQVNLSKFKFLIKFHTNLKDNCKIN